MVVSRWCEQTNTGDLTTSNMFVWLPVVSWCVLLLLLRHTSSAEMKWATNETRTNEIICSLSDNAKDDNKQQLNMRLDKHDVAQRVIKLDWSRSFWLRSQCESLRALRATAHWSVVTGQWSLLTLVVTCCANSCRNYRYYRLLPLIIAYHHHW